MGRAISSAGSSVARLGPRSLVTLSFAFAAGLEIGWILLTKASERKNIILWPGDPSLFIWATKGSLGTQINLGRPSDWPFWESRLTLCGATASSRLMGRLGALRVLGPECVFLF